MCTYVCVWQSMSCDLSVCVVCVKIHTEVTRMCSWMIRVQLYCVCDVSVHAKPECIKLLSRTMFWKLGDIFSSHKCNLQEISSFWKFMDALLQARHLLPMLFFVRLLQTVELSLIFELLFVFFYRLPCVFLHTHTHTHTHTHNTNVHTSWRLKRNDVDWIDPWICFVEPIDPWINFLNTIDPWIYFNDQIRSVDLFLDPSDTWIYSSNPERCMDLLFGPNRFVDLSFGFTRSHAHSRIEETLCVSKKICLNSWNSL